MKLDRLLAITMLLLNRQRISAQELAEYFEVSPRTIYRDIEAICRAGIPVAAFQGANGGFGIMENYRLDRQVLTSDEARSIISTLNGINRCIGDKKIGEVIEKIKAMIPHGKTDEPVEDKRLTMDFCPWFGNRKDRAIIESVNNAIGAGRVIEFHYESAGAMGRKLRLEPLALLLKSCFWYLYGYSRTDGGYRVFRLSRLRELAVTSESTVQHQGDLDERVWDRPWDLDLAAIELVLRFRPEVRERIERNFDASQIRVNEDGSLSVKVICPEDEEVYDMIMSYGDKVEVLAPEHLRLAIAERAKRIWRRYKRYS